MEEPLVSVVLTTKNEEKNIARCLDSVKNQTYKNIEIIVVDNNSADKTKEIAKKFTKKVYDKGPERSAQRNYGAEKSKGKYYLYLDADMILSKKVVEECVDMCEKKDYLALYIPEVIIGKKFWSKVRNFERSFYNSTVIDCVRFIRKDIFLEIEGFDLSLTGPEDWDFDKRIRQKGKVSIAKAPLYHDEGEFNMKNYLKKKKYYMKSFDKYIQKWGRNDPDIKKQLGGYYRLIGVFFEKGKWVKILRHPILFLGMMFLRMRVGVRYFLR